MCYRRHGHNEGDNPMFTQPVMYKNIAKKNIISDLYAKKLTQEGVVTEEWIQVCQSGFIQSREFLKACGNLQTSVPDMEKYG